jgi:hypothetical protein
VGYPGFNHDHYATWLHATGGLGKETPWTRYVVQYIGHDNSEQNAVSKWQSLSVKHHANTLAIENLRRDQTGYKVIQKTCPRTQFQYRPCVRWQGCSDSHVPLLVDLPQEALFLDYLPAQLSGARVVYA